MTHRRVAALALAVALALVGACSGDDDSGGPVALDGSPRHPDTAGVIDSATRKSVVVDGKRYNFAPRVQVFSTSTLEAVPLVGRVKQYVQLGTSGNTVHWIAVFGAAARLPGRGEVTFYTGLLKDIDGDDLIFRDGTVLRVAGSVNVPAGAEGERLNAEIDVKKDRVRAVTVAAI